MQKANQSASPHRKSNGSNSDTKLIAVLLIGIAAFMLVYSLEDAQKAEPSTQVGAIKVSTSKANMLVDQHLKSLDTKIQIDQQSRLLESYKTPAVGERLEIPAADGRNYIVESPENPIEDEVVRDLNNEEKYFNLRSPSAIIQNKVKDEERAKERYNEYVQEYVAEFLANARRHGYEVRLNQNLEVLSVTPINKPTKFKGLDPGDGAIR